MFMWIPTKSQFLLITWRSQMTWLRLRTAAYLLPQPVHKQGYNPAPRSLMQAHHTHAHGSTPRLEPNDALLHRISSTSSSKMKPCCSRGQACWP